MNEDPYNSWWTAAYYAALGLIILYAKSRSTRKRTSDSVLMEAKMKMAAKKEAP